MRVTCSHNLRPEELRKALVGLVQEAGLDDFVTDALSKALIDNTPKVPRYPAMAKLFFQFRDLYREALEWIRAYSDEFVRTGIDLRKAHGYLARPLTRQEIEKLRQAIQDRFQYIGMQLQSVDTRVPPDLLDRWKSLGLVAENVGVNDLIGGKLMRNAFLFGRLWQAVEAGKGYEEVLAAAMKLPLLKPDLAAIQVAEQSAASYVTALGNGLADDAAQLAIETNRQIIREMTTDYFRGDLMRTVNDREAKELAGEIIEELPATTWKQFSSELYHKFEDTRDWDRVAFTETANVAGQGQALALLKEYGPGKLVFKRPMKTACPQCKALYLKEDGVTPRVYRLSDMMGFGTNIGRKPMPVKAGKVISTERADGADTLKAVAGTVHPFCQCGSPIPLSSLYPWAKYATVENV